MSSSPTEIAGKVEIAMPRMGISVAEGTIVAWRKRPGDRVEADEPVCDISTDKVDVEIPAPASGTLARIVVEPGETVEVGTVLAELEVGGAAPSADDRSRVYSPIVRRMAADNHVDLEQVEGHGIGGRVRKADLVAFLEEKRERPLHTESPYRPEPEPERASASEPASVADLLGPTRREPMSPMRRQIAAHMVESRRTAAHCTTVVEVDFGHLAARRAELRPRMADRGVNLTYLAFVAREVVAALERHPILNASIEGEEIVHHEDVNLGIAVALEDGLIVPVIRRAQRLSLEGMAAAIGDLAARAREKRLQPDDVGGGTFTITNPGQFGAVLATPIINSPQVAILDLEAVVKRPVVVESGGEDMVAIRPMSYLCMSWDHRALDGAEAARFLAELKEQLEGGRSER
ncbi:MAG TPA: dihydrolipoamide acetyltransferase family protein [Solirubrobacterales bacterium]|nr:dihydrolipoamide acetyltransferase family protein [Solirubrobacterales bacterium]